MKVLVCGSRAWRDTAAVEARLLALPIGSEILHGDARGADRIADAVIRDCAIDLAVTAFPADWERHGKRAGIVRNLLMLDEKPDLVIAFWDGESRGTAHTIGEARKRGIPVEVIAP